MSDKQQMVKDILVTLVIVLALGLLGYFANYQHYLTIFYSEPLLEENSVT